MIDKEKPGKDWNGGEPDHEGIMAVTQLHRIEEMASMMLEMINENDEIPGWIQYKFSRAYDSLNDVFAYLDAVTHMETGSVAEAKKKKGLWANVHARRKAGKRPKRPGEKGYPDEKAWKKLTETQLRKFIRSIIDEK